MKKSILIGALCVLMLVAFTACEQQPSGVEQFVTEIAVTSEAPSYFKGDTPSGDAFVVTATKVNGEEFTVSSDDLKYDFGEFASAVEGDNQKIGTVTFKGVQYGYAPLTADLYANVYQMDAITVTGSETQPYYAKPVADGDAYDDLRTSAYVVTGVAKDGNDDVFSRVLTDKEYTYTATLSGDSGIATLKFTADTKFQDTDAIELDNAAKVTVLPDYIESVTAEKTDKVAYVRGTVGEETEWVTVTATYASGKTAALNSASTPAVTLAYDGEVSSTSKFTSAPVKINVTVASGVGIENKGYSGVVSINPVADKLTAFTVTNPPTLEVGKEIKASEFTVASQTWASGETAAPEGVTIDSSLLRINGATTITIPAYAAGKAYPVVLTLAGYDVSVETTLTAN